MATDDKKNNAGEKTGSTNVPHIDKGTKIITDSKKTNSEKRIRG